jgi:toxin ParE1/3/4
MKVVYTDEALRDLLDIGAYVAERYPNIALDVEELLRAIVNRIKRWPESAPEVTDRANVHAVALVHYPYKLFYRIEKDSVEILYIHHTSREPR